MGEATSRQGLDRECWRWPPATGIMRIDQELGQDRLKESALRRIMPLPLRLRAVCLALLGCSCCCAAAVKLSPRALTDSYNLRATLEAKAAGAGPPIQIVLHWQKSGDHYAVRLWPDRAELVSMVGGRTASLGKAPVASLAGRSGPLLIKRHGASFAVLIDGKYVIRAMDAHLRAGRFGVIQGQAVAVKSLRLQPIEAPRMSDDFQRLPGERGVWVTHGGEWKVASLRRPDFSANAFLFRGKGDGVLALTGEWFWQDYRLRAAVKPEAADGFGLVAAVRDGNSYLLLRFTAVDPCRAELLSVLRGHEKRLASAPGRLRPGQWHQIGLDVTEDHVVAWADGFRLFEKRLDRPLHGKLGLYAASQGGVFFDDVAVRPVAEEKMRSAGEVLDLKGAGALDAGAPEVTDTMAHDKITKDWASKHSFWEEEKRICFKETKTLWQDL